MIYQYYLFLKFFLLFFYKTKKHYNKQFSGTFTQTVPSNGQCNLFILKLVIYVSLYDY